MRKGRSTRFVRQSTIVTTLPRSPWPGPCECACICHTLPGNHCTGCLGAWCARRTSTVQRCIADPHTLHSNHFLHSDHYLRFPHSATLRRYLFYISKLLEFADTMLMVLRKKTEQVTFLHVFHHSTMFPIWWIGACCALAVLRLRPSLSHGHVDIHFRRNVC